MNTGSQLSASGITKIYRRGAEEIAALGEVDVSVEKGEFVAFIGPSGSGKTTLVNLIGCLDNPSSGKLVLNGSEVFAEGRVIGEKGLTKIRRETFGYIFQAFYLIPTLTVSENIQLPWAFYRKPQNRSGAGRLMEMLGLEKRAAHLPSQLSGGEMQRVAIARALINDPEILLADEPTGNLDTKRSAEIGEILQDLNKKNGLTVILVTHNTELASRAGRIIEMRDGKIS